ncbi:hypothetical protein AB4097_20670 [Microvirga sp. 2MCAF35]|uniref:hypothetical protein n=1 Tax=Microvirga sp. 2MCAF35 TaxID=3232987 RepID=UPI003F999959
MSHKARRRPSWRKRTGKQYNRMFAMYLIEISMGGFWQMPPGLPREEMRDWLMGRTYCDPQYYTPGSSQEEIDAHLKGKFGWRSFWYYEQFYRPFYRSK